MIYDLLFVILLYSLIILLLGPVFLVRGDDGGQDQLSNTASGMTRDPQSGPDFTSDRISALHNSSVNYGPSMNLSLSMRNASKFARSNANLLGGSGDDCKTAYDCDFVGAICSDKDKKCKCPIGQWNANRVCQPFHCSRDDDCETDGTQVCRNDGFCGCAPGFVPDGQGIECVKAPTTTTTTTTG